MDAHRFDTLTRAFTERHSRRGFSRLLVPLLGLGSLAGLGAQETEAKKRRRKRKKKHRKPPCIPNCTDKTCGPDGCDGSCGTCGADEVCSNGRCVSSCGTGKKPCAGQCIPADQCCADTDCTDPSLPHCCGGTCVGATQCCSDAHCTGGQTCQQGTCRCPSDKPLTCNGVCQQCCTVGDCKPDNTNDGQACQDGQCVCTLAGTRRCPSGTPMAGTCGNCCSDGDCPGAMACQAIANNLPTCRCTTNTYCDDTGGHRICVPTGCDGWCFRTCNIPGGPLAGQPCCGGKGAWICTETNPGVFECWPPDWV
jgi:hypothetical protein